MAIKTKHPKKTDIKRLKPVQIKKEKKILEEKKTNAALGKEEQKKEVETQQSTEEEKKNKQPQTEILDSIGREEKKRKELESLENLEDLDKNKVFEEEKEFSPEESINNPEKIDNLEDFASALPSTRPEQKSFNSPYASSSNIYGNFSAANSNYGSSSNYSGTTLNQSPSLDPDRRVTSQFISPQNTNSQTDYESRQRENINKTFEESRREMEESNVHPTQRKARRLGI